MCEYNCKNTKKISKVLINFSYFKFYLQKILNLYNTKDYSYSKYQRLTQI